MHKEIIIKPEGSNALLLRINFQKMPVSLRLPETEKRYQEYLKTLPKDYCVFCDDSKMSFENRKESYKYWFIVENEFPYDAKYETSDMLVLKRHIDNLDHLTLEEFMEMWKTINEITELGLYDQTILNAKPRQSMRRHVHFHLLNFKKG